MHSASPEVECTFWKFKTLDKAVKLDHLLFEKADVNKTSKRCLVKGISVSRGVAGVVTYDPCVVFFPTLF